MVDGQRLGGSLGAIEQTPANLYADESVCTMFERQVDRSPNAVALVCEGRSLRFRELDEKVNQLARHLQAQYDVGRGSIVGLLLGRSERMLISILAVLRAGAAYLPIVPEYPTKRVKYMLHDASPALVITEAAHTALLADFGGNSISWDADSASWSSEPTVRLKHMPEAQDLAYVMYTSGSTGRPKGVMAEHRNLSNFIQWCYEEYRDSRFEIVHAGTSFGFDLSNIELFYPLTVGRTIRLLPSSQAVGLYLRRDRSILVNTVPSLVQELLKTEGILQNVSVINLGGEPIQPSLLRALRAYPGIEVRNMYGPTETTSTSVNYRVDTSSEDILIGKPIANMFVYILDGDLRQVPVGTSGEICIGGRGLTRGYWKRPELTQERFIPDPFRSGELMYRTGDIGTYLPDGNIRCLGRNDNQVKIRGHRVELDEIANFLTTHHDVTAAVVGLVKCSAGDRLVAYASGSNGRIKPEKLIQYLKCNLPAYMVPDEMMIVNHLPLTATGKIDRQALFGAAV